MYAGDFNLFLNQSLEAKDGNHYLKSNRLVIYFTLKRNSIFVIFGKFEILKQNNVLLGNKIFQVLFKMA